MIVFGSMYIQTNEIFNFEISMINFLPFTKKKLFKMQQIS